MQGHPLDIIKTNDRELFNAVDANRAMALKDGALSLKTKLLIAIALDACKGADAGVRSLAAQALQNGVTKDEIMAALKVVNYICGAGSIYTAANGLRDIL